MSRTVQVCTHCFDVPLSDVQGSSAVGGMVRSESVAPCDVRAGDLIRHTCGAYPHAGPWWEVQHVSTDQLGGVHVGLCSDIGVSDRATLVGSGGVERRVDTRFVDYCHLCEVECDPFEAGYVQ